MSEREKRCGSPPPSTTAFLSSARSPGAVFRVAATRTAGETCRTISTASLVRVAIPLILPMMLSAVRSTRRTALAGPSSSRRISPGATALPSAERSRTVTPKCSKSARASARPAMVPRSFARTTARQATSGTTVSVVTSPHGASSLMNRSRSSSGIILPHAPTAIIRSIARRARSMTSGERTTSCSSRSSACWRSARDIFFISAQTASGFS